jgi:hypothetical protein
MLQSGILALVQRYSIGDVLDKTHFLQPPEGGDERRPARRGAVITRIVDWARTVRVDRFP